MKLRWKTCNASLLAVFFITSFAWGAAPAKLGPSPIPFNADMTLMSEDGVVMNGHVWYDSGYERREIYVEGMDMILITVPDREVLITIMPGQKMAMEMPLKPGARYYDEASMADVVLEEVGRETISGESTIKYHALGKQMDGFVWITDDGITLKLEGKMRDRKKWTEVLMIHENVVRGPVARTLFQIPAGFHIMRMPGFK